MSSASSLQRKRMTRAICSGLGHFVKSALGIALRFASVSMMLGSQESSAQIQCVHLVHRS
jgi:hypothetical protein